MHETAFTYENLHIEVTGPDQAPPLLLLHGWGSNAQLMHPVAQAFSDIYRCYNVDLPGHGFSPLPPQAWGVPEHADLVHQLIAEMIGQPVPLIGHSNGGRIGLYMASHAEHAQWVTRLALISPSGITPPRSWRYYLRKYTAKALKAPFQLLPGSLRTHGLDWLRHSLVWRGLGSFDYKALTGVMRETFVKTVNCHLDEVIHHITVPTLLFWGDQDNAVSLQQMQTLEQRIPDAGLVILKQAGHYGYLDAPDSFNAATRYFLEH